MNKVVRKVRAGARLAKHAASIRSVLREKEALRTEKDRYYTERQILFDESRNMRIFLANKYLKGEGIEIGPTYLPLPVPGDAKVSYVDIMPEEKLYELYEDIRSHKLVHIDIVDNGETLETVKDNSQDFIIANHFLEHTISPISTLQNFYRVLRQDGIIYMAVPDKRFTFDIQRPITPLSRSADYHQHPDHAEAGRYAMYLECAEYLTEIKDKQKYREWAEKSLKENYSIHFNVWAQHDIIELILYCVRELNLDLDFETIMKNEHELIVILRKFKAPKTLRAANQGAKQSAGKAIAKTKSKSKSKKRR